MRILFTQILFLFAFCTLSNAQVKILFDATKAETAGSADWVVDADLNNLNWKSNGTVTTSGSKANAQKLPTPAQSTVTASTKDTFWTGALSSWGIDLVNKGYTIETLPYNGKITYGNATNTQDLSNYKVFIVVEPNNYFTTAEKTALMNFVNNGGGLFMVSDHAGSDRNGDGSDSPSIWDDFFINNPVAQNPFGIMFDSTNPNGGAYPSDISQTTSKMLTTNNPITQGVYGTVTKVRYSGGTTMVLNTTNNATVKGVVFATQSTGSTNGVMCAYATYGKGKIVAFGDSSPCDDGTGAPASTLYKSYSGDATVADNHRNLFMNATIWLATSTTLPVSFIALSGSNENNITKLKWQADETNLQSALYQIERSLDGVHFTSVAQVVANKQQSIATYNWQIFESVENNEYYRIAAIENGNAIYSKTVLLSNPNKQQQAIHIYPNPATADFKGFYTISGLATGSQISVSDINGKTYFSTVAYDNSLKWNGKTKKDVKVPTGLYFVSIKRPDNKAVTVEKLLITGK